jgi:alcohol dehydrogenase/propanol-preferring alcohol dehydrogenase
MNVISHQLEQFGQPLVKKLRELPQLEGSQVLIRIGSCGVCHSDVHLQDGYFDLGGGARLDMGKAMQIPRTLGHEIAGTVVALGPDVTHVSLGERFVVFPWIGCAQCSICQAGEEQLCNKPQALGVHRDGGFASHLLVPHPRYLIDYGPLAEEQACTYACSGLTAYGALKKVSQVNRDQPLMIIGAGGVGLSGIRLARHMFGLAPFVVEQDRAKWDLAKQAGAGELIDPNEEGVLKSLIKSTGGGVATAIDFVGSADSFSFGVSALRKSGKMICVGLFGGASKIVPAMVTMKSLSIEGSYVGSLQDMHDLMGIARSGVLPDMPLTIESLESSSKVLENLRQGNIRGRCILKC